jgi:hypothetical protein
MYHAFVHSIGDDVTELDSEEWTNLLDRGGLTHVSDVIYMVFHAMEFSFKENFKIESNKTTKGISEKILASEDLLFYWSLVSVNWNEKESTELLRMIVEHWITIRGFSAASAFIEIYKQQNKKTVQKSKGLRKGLIST